MSCRLSARFSLARVPSLYLLLAESEPAAQRSLRFRMLLPRDAGRHGCARASLTVHCLLKLQSHAEPREQLGPEWKYGCSTKRTYSALLAVC